MSAFELLIFDLMNAVKKTLQTCTADIVGIRFPLRFKKGIYNFDTKSRTNNIAAHSQAVAVIDLTTVVSRISTFHYSTINALMFVSHDTHTHACAAKYDTKFSRSALNIFGNNITNYRVEDFMLRICTLVRHNMSLTLKMRLNCIFQRNTTGVRCNCNSHIKFLLALSFICVQ